MVDKIKSIEQLEFIHFVYLPKEGAIFGCAKEDGKVYTFLLEERGTVKARQGDTWYEVMEDLAFRIRERAKQAYLRVPTFELNGSS